MSGRHYRRGTQAQPRGQDNQRGPGRGRGGGAPQTYHQGSQASGSSSLDTSRNRGRVFDGGKGRGRGDFKGGRGGDRPDDGTHYSRGGGEGFRGGRRPAAGIDDLKFDGGNQKADYVNYRPKESPQKPPDEYEKKIQDSYNKPAKGIESLSLEVKLPLRPGYGSMGTPVQLLTNYFPLTLDRKILLHRYAISIEDPRKTKNEARAREYYSDGVPRPLNTELTGGKRRQVIRLYLDRITRETKNAKRCGIATDYIVTLVSTKQLPQEALRVSIPYVPEEADQQAQYTQTDGDRNRPVYTVRLEETAGSPLPMANLLDYVTSTQISTVFRNTSEYIQLLNIIIGFQAKSESFWPNSIMSIRSSRHFPLTAPDAAQGDLTGGLAALRGFFISVRATAERMSLNVQIKHAASYDTGPLPDIVVAFRSVHGRSLIRLANFLRGLRIVMVHVTGRPHKTIFGLARSTDGRDPDTGISLNAGTTNNATPSTAFFTDTTGQRMSVLNYFQARYNMTVSDEIPVVNVGNARHPSYLPMEVCEVVSGQPANTKLSPDQTREMIRCAVKKPAHNIEKIDKVAARALKFASPCPGLEEFGIAVSAALMAVSGRMLNPPRLLYHQKKITMPHNGSWNMRDVKFSKWGTLSSWAMVVIEANRAEKLSERAQARANDFTAELRNCGIRIGQQAFRGCIVHGYNARNETRSAQKKTIKKIMDDFGNMRPQAVLFVLCPANTDLYNPIKEYADLTYGIHAFCATKKFTEPREGAPNRQYYANMALKLNLRLGGQNQALEESQLGIVGLGKTMVVGIDVTHPSPGSSSGAPSVAAMVASVDGTLAQFPGVLYRQRGRQEEVDVLAEALVSRLELWKDKNRGQQGQGLLPQNLLIYRDGVSEGQYKIVVDNELPQIVKACKKMYGKLSLPKITIVVVSKRHNTRFYPKEANVDPKDKGNCKHGTVVDRSVTEARSWDFYLQSHFALQGTARPAHYFVIHDEIWASGRDPMATNRVQWADALQKLTHAMCYTFGRATKAVSIPPPVYYADMLAERARRYLVDFYEPDGDDPNVVHGVQSANVGPAEPRRIRIAEPLKNTMFFV